MFTYPPKPWVDGQVHQVVTEDGHYITGVYDMSSNTWNLHHGTSGGHAGLVMTTDVKTINTPPDKPIPTGTRITYPNINTQLDANWALQKQIDDIRALTTSVWIGNSLETPPLNAEGEVIYYLWYQTDNEELLHYSVQAQRYVIISGDGGANIAFSSIEPEFPSDFNVWFNVLSKESHIAYNSQWWPISDNYFSLKTREDLDAFMVATEAALKDLGDAINRISYRIECEPLAVRPQIQLVDQDQNFSNVHFDATGGLDVYSTIDSIRFDGTQLVDANELQDQRLDRIESELDAFIRQKESGTWNYNANSTATGTLEAQYQLVTNLTQAERDAAIESCTNAYQQCLANSAGDPTAASECNRLQVECQGDVPAVGVNSPVNGNFMIAKTLYINEKDAADFTHSFGDTSVGDYIELIDEPGGSEYHLALVGSKTYDSGTYTFEIVPVVSKGNLNFPNGTEFHFFSLTQDADIETLDNRYLKLTGGDLTGNLHFRDGKKLYLHGTAGRIYLEDDDKNINTTLYTSGLIDSKGTIRSDKSSGVCLEARLDGTTTWKVYADGSSQTTKPITESTNNQAHVTKGWTDGRFAKGGGITFEIQGNALYVKY